ncbi:MAG: efflux RND transporter periplasmic adaptor subunit [Deltaproteobacteria bacterium]|nr:efflux RND transporter periplasmic adaptor subunit [Deltaproteobacteria bacterium]
MRFLVRLLAVAAVALAIAACNGGAAPASSDAERIFQVDAAKVTVADVTVSLDAVGTAFASGQVDIRPQVSGTLVEVEFAEGDVVEAGQVLAVIDDSKARASLALAQAKLDSAKAKLEVATERLARYGHLAKEELVSREEYATLEAEQKAAAAAVRENDAEVRLATRNLDDFTLRAPIAGRMALRRVDAGNFIEAGTVLTTLVQTQPIEVLFSVPSAQAGGVEIGQETVVSDAAGTELGRGQLRFIDPRVDPDTRMVTLKALVPNADDKLRSGQFVQVRLVREVHKDALLVPEDAVMALSGKTWVYVVDDGHALRREVTLGVRRPQAVEVTSGLRAGDTIVVRGQHRLTDGAGVTIAEAARG